MGAERYDVVVVGARCAGSTLAALLAREGQRVLLIDRDRFPSDTVSTHAMFPDTMQRLDQLGVMQRLRARHDIPLLRWSFRMLGHELQGPFTAIGGYDRLCCVRRIVLDSALVDAAVAAGAEPRFGSTVTDLIGAGTPEDPVRGVVLDRQTRIEARWVIGADGRTSTVARRLGLRPTRELRGEQSILMAYWRGLPATEWSRIDVQDTAALLSTPCEDGVHLLAVLAGPDFTRGNATARETRYIDGLHRFPDLLGPGLLDSAERASPLIVVPETMMRGHFRQASGSGWVLVGDAGHYKHPATAQGIGDAIEQAWFVAGAMTDGGDLSGYERWRDDRAAEHYEWSFQMARFGTGPAAAIFAGLAADHTAAQQFRDLFTKQTRPSQVYTPERIARWKAAAAHEDARGRVTTLVEGLDHEALATAVPTRPGWTIRDLLADLVGAAEHTVQGTLPAPSAGDVRSLLLAWADHGARLEESLRRGDGFAADAPPEMLTAPVVDLATRLQDLREALGQPGDRDAPACRLALAVHRAGLEKRIAERGLPALRLCEGGEPRVLGEGAPEATLTIDRHELFRALSGRRNASQIRAYDWEGDPDAYLSVIAPPSPTPLPAVGASRPGALAGGADR